MRQLAGLMMFLATGAACAHPGADAGARAGHGAAVAFWTSGYTGAELASDNFHCAAPEVPPISHANQQIRSVYKAIAKWERCHESYMAALRATPADARIPAAVLEAMTPAERVQARAHVEAVQARIAAAAEANAQAMTVRHATWLGATVEYVGRHNSELSRSRAVLARNADFARREAASERLEQRERLRAAGY